MLLLHAATKTARAWLSRSRTKQGVASTLGPSMSIERFNASHIAEVLLAPVQEADLQLDGLPLVLRTCNQTLLQWQAWAIAAPEPQRADDDVADPPVRLLTDALSGTPGFCISAGPGATLRDDRAPLAQLTSCNTNFARRLAVATHSNWWMFDVASNDAVFNNTRSDLRDDAEYSPSNIDLATSSEADSLYAHKAARLFASWLKHTLRLDCPLFDMSIVSSRDVR